MKKNLLLSAFLLISLTVLSQEWNFGAKAGVNFAKITGDKTTTYNNHTGFFVGVFADKKLSDKFTFQPEILYCAQGAEVSDSGMTATLKVNYLAVPLMFKYYVANQFAFEMGPQLAILLSSKVESMGISVDIKDELKDFEFGLNFGLSYEFNKFMINGRYNLGLSKINNSTFEDGSSIKNSVIQIGVGYRF